MRLSSCAARRMSLPTASIHRRSPAALRRLMGGSHRGDPGLDATRLLCGHFEWDVSLDHPLFRELLKTSWCGASSIARTRRCFGLWSH